MRLEIASRKAIKYSCLNFHYAKSVPNVSLAYSVFNKNNEFCGTICYGLGANQYIAKEFGLMQGQVIELLRVALNGKQELTSKALSISLKLIRKDCPLVKLIVSYADNNEGHYGIIYQSTNWHYIGEYAKQRGIMLNGKLTHKRSISSKYNTSSLDYLKKNVDKNAEIIIGKCKYKYVYVLDKNIRKQIMDMSKKYPKNAVEVH